MQSGDNLYSSALVRMMLSSLSVPAKVPMKMRPSDIEMRMNWHGRDCNLTIAGVCGFMIKDGEEFPGRMTGGEAMIRVWL